MARVDVGGEVVNGVLETVSWALGGSGRGTEDEVKRITSVVEGDFEIFVTIFSVGESVFEDLGGSRLDVEGLFSPVTDEEESESKGDGGMRSGNRSASLNDGSSVVRTEDSDTLEFASVGFVTGVLKSP